MHYIAFGLVFLAYTLFRIYYDDWKRRVVVSDSDPSRDDGKFEHAHLPGRDPIFMGGGKPAASTSLIIWAAVAAALNTTVLLLFTIALPSKSSASTLFVWMVGAHSMVAPLEILVLAFFKADSFGNRVNIRRAILDGVVFPPAFALCIAGIYPEILAMLGDLAYLAASTYTLQAPVWMYFFCRARNQPLWMGVP